MPLDNFIIFRRICNKRTSSHESSTKRGLLRPTLWVVECSHRVIYLPVLCHGMPYPDLACHIEWSQCERKTFHGERFTCKFFHCMPHPDLACRTESSNLKIFNCQSSVMVCHTLTLPVLLSAASWLPMKNRLLMTIYIWNLPARGENTFIQWSSTTFSPYTKQTF